VRHNHPFFDPSSRITAN